MTTSHGAHRLGGLDPDHLLAFLALLGTVRAIEAARPDLAPRIAWPAEEAPWRPRLQLAKGLDRAGLDDIIARGVELLAADHADDRRPDTGRSGEGRPRDRA